MGFDEIYLVGCDYTHENSRMGHWYEMGNGTLVIHKDYKKIFFDVVEMRYIYNNYKKEAYYQV